MAKKIELFRTIRNSHQKLGIHLPQSNQNVRFNPTNLSILLIQSLAFISVTAFLIFRASSIEEYGTSFSGCIMISTNTIFNLINIIKIENIVKLIGQFEDFIEMRTQSNPTSKTTYTNLNERIELISKWAYTFMIEIICFGFTITTLVSCYANYYIFDLKDDAFILPVPLISPLDWTTPFGFFVTFLSLVGAYYFVIYCMYQTMGFFAGSCGLIINFVRDISSDLELLNVGGKSNENDKKIRFCQMIQQHSDVKQFVGEINKITEFVTFAYVLWTFGSICMSLLVLLKQLSDNSNVVELIGTTMQVISTFTGLFIYCEFGERLTSEFNSFHEKLCECQWYLISIEMQRIYLIALSGAQDPAVIEGFANATCTRESYKKTMKGGFSYFTMLRRIDG